MVKAGLSARAVNHNVSGLCSKSGLGTQVTASASQQVVVREGAAPHQHEEHTH